MQIKIPDEVSVRFTGKGISYVLDVLAGQPFKEVNGLINDIVGQLQKQGESDGPKRGGLDQDTTSRRDSGFSDSGIPPMEG